MIRNTILIWYIIISVHRITDCSLVLNHHNHITNKIFLQKFKGNNESWTESIEKNYSFVCQKSHLFFLISISYKIYKTFHAK